MSALKPGSLLVAQDDITDPFDGTVLIREGVHMMYLEHLTPRGHKVVDTTTLRKFVLDEGLEFSDADGTGALFVVRGRFQDLPIHAQRIRSVSQP